MARGPLHYKTKSGEVTFATGAVRVARIERHNFDRAARSYWTTDVNDVTVCRGTETQARAAYERALKYIH